MSWNQPIKMQLTNLIRRIHDTIMNHLNEHWVSETYNWQQDFLAYYFTFWFDTIGQCLHAIDNNAEHLLGIMKWNERYSYHTFHPVLNFNQYVYSFAEYELNHHHRIVSKVREIIILKRVKHIVPLVVHRLLLPELTKTITSYLY